MKLNSMPMMMMILDDDVEEKEGWMDGCHVHCISLMLAVNC